MIETNIVTNHITRQIAGLSPAQRALLELRLLKRNQREQPARSGITRGHLQTAPLSYNQHGLWVLHQFLRGQSIYHTPLAARLTGVLDVEALRQSFQAIVDRHE